VKKHGLIVIGHDFGRGSSRWGGAQVPRFWLKFNASTRPDWQVEACRLRNDL